MNAETPIVRAPSEAEIRTWIIRHVANAAKIPEAQLDIHTPLAEYGLNSRQAVGLSGALEEWLKRELDPTLVWDHPSIEQLARHLSQLKPADA